MSGRPAIMGERRWVALALLVAVAMGQAATMVATAFATRDIFRLLRDGGPEPRAALATIAAAGVALCVLRALEGRIGERAGQSYAAAIRRTLFLHVTMMPASDVARRRSGALALRYVGDLAAFRGWVARGVSRLISAAVTIPAALAILAVLEPRLFLAAIFPIAAVLGGMLLLAGPLGDAHADLRSERARLAAAMAERLPQGIALRRSGRARIELKQLVARSRSLARAAIRREWLASIVRALPDAGSGVAAALCLWTCIRLELGVADAVAALTALAMVVWPLRHLADVTDRRRAYVVASGKLDRMLATRRMPRRARMDPDTAAPAIRIEGARLPGLDAFDLKLERGALRRLAGPSGSGKSALLKALAGLDDAPVAERFDVLGAAPGTTRTGLVLYLGRHAPHLKGSLRRDVTMGIGRTPEDVEILGAIDRAGLAAMTDRLGGLSGKVLEGRRNLTATEAARLWLVRGLLARPALALIDADEIGLKGADLGMLVDHLVAAKSAALIVTSDPATTLRLGPGIEMECDTQAARQGLPACT